MSEYKKLSEFKPKPKPGDVFKSRCGRTMYVVGYNFARFSDWKSDSSQHFDIFDGEGYKFKRYDSDKTPHSAPPSGKNTRAEILRIASELINGDRQDDYGTPQENFGRIAAGWSVILGKDVTPEQVARCMAWLKIARLNNGPHKDSYIDAAGYMALAAELGLEE